MDLEKIKFMLYALKDIGGRNARAFSLNLNPDIACRCAVEPDWLLRRIVRFVGRHVPLVVALDAAPISDRLHVHGAFAGANPDDANRIEIALEAAGGMWAADRGRVYQLLSKPLGGDSGPIDGWLVYLAKGIGAAAAIVGAKRAWTATNAVRRHAKAMHADVRRSVNEAIRLGGQLR
jgi:hypothetical protein